MRNIIGSISTIMYVVGVIALMIHVAMMPLADAINWWWVGFWAIVGFSGAVVTGLLGMPDPLESANVRGSD